MTATHEETAPPPKPQRRNRWPSRRLNERERAIVHDRILADEPRTLQELADDYGISRERVRQLEKNALAKLKGALAAA